MIIPRVYQMMSLLEGNTCSKDQGKRNELLFAFFFRCIRQSLQISGTPFPREFRPLKR